MFVIDISVIYCYDKDMEILRRAAIWRKPEEKNYCK